MTRSLKLIFLVIMLSLGAALLPFSARGSTPADVKISVQKSYAFNLGDTTIVTKTLAGRDASSSPWVKTLYNTCRMFLDIAAFLLLIYIAFMNILQKDIETYAIKKMLPPAIYALILGNLGLPIFALISRMIDALMGIQMFSPLNLTQIYAIIIGGDLVGGGLLISVLMVVAALSFWNCFGWCFFFIILGVPLFGVIILNLLLSLRPMVIYMAAAISPIAFAANILPGTQQYFKRWLGIIMPWMIFPPLVAFMFYVAGLLPANTAVNVNWTDGFVTKVISIALPIVMKAGILYFAIRLPFTLEKDIAVLAATAGKATANWGWNKGRDLGGKLYNSIDDREKKYMNTEFNATRHQDAAAKKAGDLVSRKEFEDADGNLIDSAGYNQAKEDFVKSNPKIVRSFAKGSAKDEFKSKHKLAYGALKYNPFGLMDAYKEGKEIRSAKGVTAGKKFSAINAAVGGKNYEGKYKLDSTASDLKEVNTAGEVYSYDPATFTKLERQVRDELDSATKNNDVADLRGAYRSYKGLTTEEEKTKFARRQLLEELRDMSTNDAGDSAYSARWNISAKDGGQLHAINRRLWAVAGRTTSRNEETALTTVQDVLEGRITAPTVRPQTSPVGNIGEIQDVSGRGLPAADEDDGSVSGVIARAVDSLGNSITGELPAAIVSGLNGAKIKADMPEIRATVDSFAGEALAHIGRSGLDVNGARSYIEAASMGNLGAVESAIRSHPAIGGDPNTNPFFLALRRAAGAGYLQRSTENNIVQEIAKSEDTGTTLMMAQRLAPAMAQQGGEGLVSQHLKTLVDVTAGVQVEPQVKQDMQRYFENLNLGVKVGGELQIDPSRVQSALTALKSPEFQINPRVAIGKATLSNGYAQNVQDAVKAAIANKIPDDAIAFDQSVQLRLNETIRAEANVRGVDLSKASMEAIEKAKAQIQSQIVNGNNPQMAVTQAFDVIVQAQSQIIRQNTVAPQGQQQTSSPGMQAPPPSQPIATQAEEIRTTAPTEPPQQPTQ